MQMENIFQWENKWGNLDIQYKKVINKNNTKSLQINEKTLTKSLKYGKVYKLCSKCGAQLKKRIV